MIFVMDEKDGGPAFPRPASTDNGNCSHSEGMSLLDYFAAAILPAIWKQADDCGASITECVAECYQVADAMLTERAKGGGQ